MIVVGRRYWFAWPVSAWPRQAPRRWPRGKARSRSAGSSSRERCSTGLRSERRPGSGTSVSFPRRLPLWPTAATSGCDVDRTGGTWPQRRSVPPFVTGRRRTFQPGAFCRSCRKQLVRNDRKDLRAGLASYSGEMQRSGIDLRVTGKPFRAGLNCRVLGILGRSIVQVNECTIVVSPRIGREAGNSSDCGNSSPGPRLASRGSGPMCRRSLKQTERQVTVQS